MAAPALRPDLRVRARPACACLCARGARRARKVRVCACAQGARRARARKASHTGARRSIVLRFCLLPLRAMADGESTSVDGKGSRDEETGVAGSNLSLVASSTRPSTAADAGAAVHVHDGSAAGGDAPSVEDSPPPSAGGSMGATSGRGAVPTPMLGVGGEGGRGQRVMLKGDSFRVAVQLHVGSRSAVHSAALAAFALPADAERHTAFDDRAAVDGAGARACHAATPLPLACAHAPARATPMRARPSCYASKRIAHS